MPAVTGIDKSCSIRPPRCATGPRVVTTSRRAVAFDRSQVETGAFQINFNMVHCMEGSETVRVHPLMRDESGTSEGAEGQTSSSTFSPEKKAAPPKGPYAQQPSPGGRRTSTRSKDNKSPKKKPATKQSSLGAGGAEGQGNSFSSITPSSSTNVTDHEQIPFAVKTQLEVWLAAFKEEASHHRSKTICYETLLTRVREISVDEEQPTLFSLVTALILLTQFVPLLGPYGDLMQGTIAEIASAVYLLPSKGVGFTVALDAYAKKAFFDAYREVKQLFDMHQARAKRYKSLQRLEANVLQGSVDRWSWQCLNMAFRGWRTVIRFKRKQTERSAGYFHRWQLRTFVPRSIRGWARIAKVRLLLAVELDDGEDGQNSQLKQLYSLQQRYKAQRIVAEGELERLTLTEKKNALHLTSLRTREIEVSDFVRESYEGRAVVAHHWAQVMHLLFGDVHDLAAAHAAASATTPQHQSFKAALEDMFLSISSVNPNERRRSTAVALLGNSAQGEGGATPSASPSRHESMVGGGAAARRMSVNLSDNAASLKKRANTRSHRLNMQQLISVILKFAPHLRDCVPRVSVPIATSSASNRVGQQRDSISSPGFTSSGLTASSSTAGATREDNAELVVLLLSRMFGLLGAASPQFPIRITDLIQHDQGTLKSTIQEVWWALCGGHCSLFLTETCLGPPKALSLPHYHHQQHQYGHHHHRRLSSSTTPPHQSPAARSIASPVPGANHSIGSSGTATSVESSFTAVPAHYGHHHYNTQTPPLQHLLDKSTTAPMLVYEQRHPFESAVLFPAHRPQGEDGVEAAWMVLDTQRGMDLLEPLQELRKVSDENWVRISQQGDARGVHQLAQELMAAFSLFFEQRPPPGMVQTTISSFVRPRDKKRIAAAFPAPHIIHNAMDLVEYVQEVAGITGFAMKSVLTWTLSSLDLSPMERLFVAASNEEVISAVHMNRDAMKSLMRQCSSMVTIPSASANGASSSSSVLPFSESSRTRLQQRGAPVAVKKLLVQREKFIAAMMSKMSAATLISKEQLDEAFTLTLQIRHGTYEQTGNTAAAGGGLRLPPIANPAHSAATGAPLVAFDNSSATTTVSEEELIHTDEQGFTVLLLFCAHFLDPDPFLPSAAKIGKFLEWVSKQ